MNFRARRLSFLALPIVLFQMACETPTDPSSSQAVPLEPERFLFALPAPPEVVPTAYWAIDALGADLSATDINDVGDVVGHHYSPEGALDADFFLSAGTSTPTLLTTNTQAYLWSVTVNNASPAQVTGTSAAPGDPHTYVGYRWDASAGQSALPPLPGDGRSSVSDVSDNGIAVGASTNAYLDLSDHLQAVRWTAAGDVESLGTLGGTGTNSRAYGIDATTGLIVGQAEGDVDEWLPFLWRPGTEAMEVLTALHDAVDAVMPGASVVPVDINESEGIVGYFVNPTTHKRTAYFWDGSLHVLGAAEGLTDAAGLALNESDQVVIQAYAPALRGWVWTPETGMLQLPGPDGATTIAQGINRYAQVAGTIEGVGAVVWNPLASVDEVLDDLTASTEDVLTTAGLTETDGNGLRAKLDAIRNHLEHGQANAARNQLQAFINQVEAMVADGRLSEADGATLIAEAQALMALIEE